MPKFRKKPVEIEARQWTGTPQVATSLIDWMLSHGQTSAYHEALEHLRAGNGLTSQEYDTEHLRIRTLEGTMRAEIGDWIIKGVQGEFYPCKPDIFEQTYEEVS